MENGEILAKAFWSRGRGVFLILTVNDAANRLGISKSEAETALVRMSGAGLVRHKVHATGGNVVSIWSATDAGKEVAKGFIK